mgnify:CR=1 FL=1
MNNKRATKRALLTSVTALVMCVVMLVGTTFAWFTDTASTGVNKIVAGNLDVALEMKNPDYNSTVPNSKEWISAEGKTLNFTKKVDVATDGSTAETTPAAEILWEPGCRYQLPELRVVNNGNLALKYKIQITGIQGDAKLNEVIDWTINDAAINLTEQRLAAKTAGEAFTIKGVMQTTAGNEYQGLSIDGIAITVYATQDTVENDSFGPDYDKNATYYPVLDAAGMKDALVNGGNIKVDANVDVDGDALVVAKKTTIDMNGKTLSNNGVDIWNEDTGSWSLISARNGAELTITGNGTFKAKENDSFAVDVQDSATVTIENGTFIGNVHAVYVYEGTAYIKGGFYSVQQKYNVAGKENEFVLNCYDANRNAGTAKIIVTGGTFVNFNPADCWAEGAHTNFVADGYSVISETKANGDTWYTVVEGTAVKEPTNEAFADAVASVENGGTVVLPAGDYTIPANAKGKTLTITGTEGAKIECVKAGEGDYGLDSATVTFKGVTLDFGEQDFNGYVRAKATYIDCTINGRITLGGESTFTNCTFNNMAGYNVWTWGSDATFENCTFNCGGKSVLVYGGSTSTVTINRCTFNDLGGFDGKAAIETGSSYGESFTININKVTVNGFAVNPEGISTNSTIWANKNSMPKDRLNVVIDGTKVY